MSTNYKFRYFPENSDLKNVEEIIKSSGFFLDHEIPVAVGLVEEWLSEKEKSGYYFIFIDFSDRPAAFACYGEIPCTVGSYDLYWIASHDDYRGKGLGTLLLNEVERKIKEINGRLLYIETSMKDLYAPTRHFYLKNKYKKEAVFKNFYNIGDHKVIYSKEL